MAEITVTLSPNLETLPARLTKALQVAHETSARELVNEVRQQIVGAGAVATFSLLRSVTKQFEERGAAQAWLVGSDLAYAPFVEYGRKPGKQPPVEAILKWLAIRGIQPGTRGQAFAIARAIGKRGIKGRFPFRRALDAQVPEIETTFERELTRTINE